MAVRRWGAEEQVNAGVAGLQGAPVLAALPGGGFVLAWVDESDPLGSRVLFQVHDSAGEPLGPPGSVAAAGDLSGLSIVALADGGFVIGLEGGADGQRDAQVFRFDAGGSPQGSLELDPLGGAVSTAPLLAPLGTGFVALHSENGDLLASWYDASGALLGGEITVNATTAGPQTHADLAALTRGGFVAVWADLNLDRIHFRVFQADGNPVTDDIQANGTSLGQSEGFPSVAGLRSGAFVVVWETDSPLFPGSDPDIRARLFTPTGAPFGADFPVNTTTFSAQGQPEVVALRNGGFAVVWADQSENPGLHGQLFDAYGLRLGGEFTVNTGPLPADMGPGDITLDELADGRIAVAWRGTDDDGSGIFRQILDPRDGVVNGTASGEALWGNDAWGDEVNAFGGRDTLWGLRGEDVLFAGDGDDLLQGGRGDDLLYGNRGDDTLAGDTGADDLFGGVGQDTASYAGAAGVTLALDGSLEGAGAALGDQFRGIEVVLGSAGADRLRGSAAAETLRGDEGADLLEGLGGNDTLDGGGGDDRLAGGAGADRLDGGGGLDLASFSGAGAAVALALDGSLLATGEAAGDLMTGIEGVEGSGFADLLRGDGAANLLTGGDGGDTLEGLGGDDSLSGEGGNDHLAGGQGADLILGGGGDDVLLGGAGSDSLVGGLGADDFVFAALSDSATDGTRDRVADFLRGTDDLILTAIDANTALAGNQAFVLDADGSFSRGEIRQVLVNGGLRIELNVDATTAAEMSVFLSGVAAPLTAGDFAL